MEELLFKGELDNEELEKLIADMKGDNTPERTARVIDEAERCTFLVPVTLRDGNISLNVFSGSDGRTYLSAFTSSRKKDKCPEVRDNEAVTSSFYDMAELMNDGRFEFDGLIINPGEDDVILGAEILIKLLDATDDSIRVGEPNMYPPQMFDRIREFCRDEKRIADVTVRFFVRKKSGVSGWLFVITSDGEDNEKEYIYDTFGRFMEPALDGLKYMVLDSSLEYAKTAARGAKPCYVRDGN